MTYGGKGLMKRGAHAKDHAAIYSGKRPSIANGEVDKGLILRPIKFYPSSKTHELHPMSRINYAKVYTVEHNVKVWFIGRVAKESEPDLVADYNKVHPPLQLPLLN